MLETSGTRRIALLLGLLLGVCALPLLGQPASRETRPAGLMLVPPQALGFLHVRLADVWYSDLGEAVRQKMPKETLQLARQIEKLWGVAPTDVESVTMLFLGEGGGIPPPGPASKRDAQAEKRRPAKPRPEPVGTTFNPVIVTTTRAYDRDRVRDAVAPMAETRSHKDRLYFVSQKPGAPALHFVNERVFWWAAEPELKRLLERPAPPGDKGPLDQALSQAAQRHHLAGGLNLAAPPVAPWLALYKLSVQNSPEAKALLPLAPLFEAHSLSFTLDLGVNTEASLRLLFADEAKARQARKAGETLAAMARKEASPLLLELNKERGVPNLIRVLKQVDAAGQAPVVEQKGNAVTITLRVRGELAVWAEAALEGSDLYAREQARTLSGDNLRKIGEAIEVYDNLNNHYPQQAILSKEGKPLLSWRVAILPHLGEEELFKQFKLDEPWDGPHNRGLLPKMPRVYASLTPQPEPHVTFYRGFAGKGAFFESGRKLRYSDIADGTQNTIMVVEAARPVPWTKPDELLFDPGQNSKLGGVLGDPVGDLVGGLFPEGFHALFCDGRTVHFIRKGAGEAALRALITRAGGEKVDLRKLR